MQCPPPCLLIRSAFDLRVLSTRHTSHRSLKFFFMYIFNQNIPLLITSPLLLKHYMLRADIDTLKHSPFPFFATLLELPQAPSATLSVTCQSNARPPAHPSYSIKKSSPCHTSHTHTAYNTHATPLAFQIPLQAKTSTLPHKLC